MTDPLRTTLIRHTNHTGLILASEELLARELKLAPGEVRRRIAALESRREIEILAPLPFLSPGPVRGLANPSIA